MPKYYEFKVAGYYLYFTSFYYNIFMVNIPYSQ